MKHFLSVDAYINSFPEDVKIKLVAMRKIILETAPEAVESISYGMPAYKLRKKPLVYFGAYKNHIGFYATPTGHKQFQKELSKYKQGKGSVQFPLNEALPLDLIGKMVAFRMEEVGGR
ncbi:DUF1801 domain-containing protein [Flavobacteriaceae bacterium XHP0103]|uniref:iron chaperone n=1 Tax=Marixanthotalea marina TaxID=2844359 RepID=UPI002989F64D|nr:DUF1801 domain-containing protein [Marixanthotalea marina]MBU3821619.1 DUF1801 domain-containing protein [Marixanthotalea marina]